MTNGYIIILIIIWYKGKRNVGRLISRGSPSAVGPGKGASLGGSPTGQQVREEGRRSGTDVSMEGGHREHAQLIQRRLGRFGDVLQQALQAETEKKKCSFKCPF